jgi:hypothetical protein
MNQIYRVTIHGRVLESKNLKQLLSRAVAEKRDMDTRCRVVRRDRASWAPGLLGLPIAEPGACHQGSL